MNELIILLCVLLLFVLGCVLISTILLLQKRKNVSLDCEVYHIGRYSFQASDQNDNNN